MWCLEFCRLRVKSKAGSSLSLVARAPEGDSGRGTVMDGPVRQRCWHHEVL